MMTKISISRRKLENSLLNLPTNAEIRAREELRNEKERLRLAGHIAAQQLKLHPEVVKDVLDPVERWKKLREEILSHFGLS